MNKKEFLSALEKGLSFLPQEELEERLAFYTEMIDDRIEEGFSEEDAVADVGDVDSIIAQHISNTPMTKIVKEKIKPKRSLLFWEILLIILGAPLWLPLLAAAFATVVGLFVGVISVIIGLWAIGFAVVVCALAGIFVSIFFLLKGLLMPSLVMLGLLLICAGAGILFFLICHGITKGIIFLIRKLIFWIKSLFIKGEK